MSTPDTGTATNRCPQCGRTFPATVRLCPNDGTVLDEQTPAGSKNLGTVLDGKYRLDSYLSKGGMGSVYKATHVMLNKAVAVKMINAEIVTSPEVVRRFQREARAATTLNHPNIAGVYDLGQTGDGTLYIAMEFIDGPSLKSVLTKEGPMAPARIVSLMWQVSAALAIAHKHSIIHRDLKPHNIMLTRDDHGREVAKLVDFGIAKTFDEGTQLTQTGFVVGTPQYMAPEQAEGRPVDARSDIYSLGVILYEMLSGDVPFNDPSTPMVLIKHIKETPVLPSLKNPNVHVSPELEGIAMRCLQKDPAARFQSASEFGNALNAVPLTPGGEAMKKDPAAAAAWDFTTLVQAGPQSTPMGAAPTVLAGAPTVLNTGAPTMMAQGAPTIIESPTAATIPTPMPQPQQKTQMGQTAPPLPTVASTAVVAGPSPAPMSTMSAPPVVTAPHPVAPAATISSSESSSSSKTPMLIAVAAVVLLGVIAGAWYLFGRSSPASAPSATTTSASNAAPSEPSAPAPVSSAASSTPSTPANPPSSAAPPSDAAAPPSNPPAAPAAPAASTPAVTPASTSAAPSVPSVPSGAPSRAASSPRPTGTAPARPTPAAGATAAAAQPAVQPPPVAAAFPSNPAVAFRCSGAADVCSAIRAAVDDALPKAGLRSMRDPARADVLVEANVAPVENRVSNDFGTTFAVRTYTIDVSGEAPHLGDSVPMPSSSTLSYDPKFGSERVNEKARLVADGIVEKIKAFAAKQR